MKPDGDFSVVWSVLWHCLLDGGKVF